MSFGDLIAETLHSLTCNKVRSGLTILGIVVGIASVIAMVAIGEGSQASVTNGIESVGSNLLTVRPSAPGGRAGQARAWLRASVQSLTRRGRRGDRGTAGVAAVAPAGSSFAQLVAGLEQRERPGHGQSRPRTPNVNLSVASRRVHHRARRQDAYAQGGGARLQTAIDLFGEDVDPVGQRVRVGQPHAHRRRRARGEGRIGS